MKYTDTMKHSNTRTGQKLARFKHKANEWNKKHSHSETTWQERAKFEFQFGPGYNRYGISSGFEEITGKSGAKIVTGIRFSNLWFHCDPSEIAGYRAHDDSHDLIRLDHTGWYCDDFQNETVRGIVGVFRWGKKVYIVPGVMYSDSDCHSYDLTQCETLTPSEAFDDRGYQTDTLADTMREVARVADQMAEKTGEESREADQEFQAEQLCEQLQDKIQETRETVRKLIKEIKSAGKAFSPTICETLRDKVQDLMIEIRQYRKAISTVKDSPYRYSDFNSLV
jgi:hypothetical protein